MRALLALCLLLQAPINWAPSAVAADLRHDILGCWSMEPSDETKRSLAEMPGSVSDVQLCFKRNGETRSDSVVGGGHADGMMFEMEGMSGAGRYYLSGQRVVIHGLFAFDSYGPLSCVIHFPSKDRLELTDCINGFLKGVWQPDGPRTYARSEERP